MTKKAEIDRVVEVYWLDAMADTNDYDSVEEIRRKRPYYCLRKTVGYYVDEDDEYLILAEDMTIEFQGKGGVSGLLGIPKGMIKKKKYLK